MFRLLAVPLAAAALTTSVQPLPGQMHARLNGPFWRAGCPVPLSDLRLLTTKYWGFDARPHAGQLVVNERYAVQLAGVFERLYDLRFPIRHLTFADMYGRAHPADGDISGSFECRQAVPSPCSGGTGTGTWSMHAYGLAIDLNPVENPYVGCGQSRDPKSRRYFDRSRLRKGMVTPAVVRAFAAIGWGWGGSWSGSTKDYMHFSSTGH
jgi:hypothetical protein